MMQDMMEMMKKQAKPWIAHINSLFTLCFVIVFASEQFVLLFC